jgi:hypothetical protein
MGHRPEEVVMANSYGWSDRNSPIRLASDSESFWSGDVLSLVLAVWCGLVFLVICWKFSKRVATWWTRPAPISEPVYVPPPPPPTKADLVAGVNSEYHENCGLINSTPMKDFEKEIGHDIMREKLINKIEKIL